MFKVPKYVINAASVHLNSEFDLDAASPVCLLYACGEEVGAFCEVLHWVHKQSPASYQTAQRQVKKQQCKVH